ncbi:hypothetical protein Gotur_004638 [Gossypium turneri]|uniref:Uncharacterized protein n=1 Tax=Gossypium armourianum TaxID=34283 RepID=A0A7J9IU68_9ROSI|nr:hypothetical protein [Gossypium armourianum]
MNLILPIRVQMCLRGHQKA